MPSPECEPLGPGDSSNLEEWLVSLLDHKFAQQETVIRGLLERKPQAQSYPDRTLSSFSAERNANMGTASPGSPMDDSQSEAAGEPMYPLRSDATTSDDVARTSSKTVARKNTATLGAAVMSERWDPDPPWKSFIKKRLDGYMGVVVIVNMIFMVLMTQWTGSNAEVSRSSREAELSRSLCGHT